MDEKQTHKIAKSHAKPKQSRSERTPEQGRPALTSQEIRQQKREDRARKHRRLMDRHEINPSDVHKLRGF